MQRSKEVSRKKGKRIEYNHWKLIYRAGKQIKKKFKQVHIDSCRNQTCKKKVSHEKISESPSKKSAPTEQTRKLYKKEKEKRYTSQVKSVLEEKKKQGGGFLTKG